MASPEEFAATCRDTARSMRRLPKELRRALGREVKEQVADPLAADIRSAWRGPQSRALSAATKTRVSTDPQIVVGGARRVVSGGASARQLVYGNEWGGGRRVTSIPRTARRAGHRRRTTRQFPQTGQHAIYGTIHDTLDRSFEKWADAVARIIDDLIPDRS